MASRVFSCFNLRPAFRLSTDFEAKDWVAEGNGSMRFLQLWVMNSHPGFHASRV
jgi:hypothetical protein